MNTLKTCTKAYARKLNTVTLNGIQSDEQRLDLIQVGIINAVKYNVTSKTKTKDISGIIRSVLAANIRCAFAESDIWEAGFNLQAPKNRKNGSYSTIDNRYGFAVHNDGNAVVFDNTTQCWISRTCANIRKIGLDAWEEQVEADRDLITVQPPKAERTGSKPKAKARTCPKFVSTFTDAYTAKLEAAIVACATNDNGKYVTSKVFNENVAKLVASLDKALKVA